MEAFKFAFETVIIGMLALPWLAVLIDLARPSLFTNHPQLGIGRMLSCMPKETRTPLIGVVAFAIAYLLGSAISPVSCEFLNDADWIGRLLPTETELQVRVYQKMRSGDAEAQPLVAGFQPVEVSPASYEQKATVPKGAKLTPNAVAALFRFQEDSLLLQGTDSCERINRLHERDMVLRGATFSAFVLLLVCAFACCARYRCDWKAAQSSVWKRYGSWLTFAPCLTVIALAVYYGGQDLLQSEVDDMPIMETIMLLLGAFGFYVIVRGIRPGAYITSWTCLIALFFAVLCYGGWACTEVTYDEHVFQSFKAAHTDVAHKPMVHAEN